MSALFPWLEPRPPKPDLPPAQATDAEILDALAREDWDWFEPHGAHLWAVMAALARAIERRP